MPDIDASCLKTRKIFLGDKVSLRRHAFRFIVQDPTTKAQKTTADLADQLCKLCSDLKFHLSQKVQDMESMEVDQ